MNSLSYAGRERKKTKDELNCCQSEAKEKRARKLLTEPTMRRKKLSATWTFLLERCGNMMGRGWSKQCLPFIPGLGFSGKLDIFAALFASSVSLSNDDWGDNGILLNFCGSTGNDRDRPGRLNTSGLSLITSSTPLVILSGWRLWVFWIFGWPMGGFGCAVGGRPGGLKWYSNEPPIPESFFTSLWCLCQPSIRRETFSAWGNSLIFES